ncbi:cytochrome P450 [Xylogone sp. PMI_703]|nr:cytochrome P450 [Xylogone sp. PMI_703]
MNQLSETIFSRNSSWGFVVLGGGAVILLLTTRLFLRGLKSKYPLPPGPKGLPIIGNIQQVPAQRSDVQFAKWATEYNSDVIYLNLLGQDVIVLNSAKSAVDLLDKRGSIYSDRPPFAMLEALGFLNNLALIPDNAQFRKVRRPFGTILSTSGSLTYRTAQLKFARDMAHEIESHPEKWDDCLLRFSTRVIFNMAFAIDIIDERDAYFNLADEVGWIISNMGNNTITILDALPWVQYIPRWIGRYIPSVKYVHDHSPTVEEFHQRPFDAMMTKFKSGTVEPSFLGRLIKERETQELDKEKATKRFTDAELKGIGGVLYAAGQDTTHSATMVFVMGMILSPKVQTRAQKEIDALTGGARLPTFDDWKALPIIERIVHETLRFHPPVPNGIPHKTTKEDVYRDMYIPKRAMVIANSWAMTHDPNVYKDPFEFNPDRFLPASDGGTGEPIPVGPFGFGRRICPGQYLGFASVWIVAATILAKFNISPAKDEHEQDILPKLEFTTGVTSHPASFSCVFTPRNSL